MNNLQETKLSSNWTKVGLFGGGLLSICMIPILYYTGKDQPFHYGLVVAGILYLFVIAFIVYQFIYTCEAWVIGDKLVLKKLFREAKSYSFDKIGVPSSFQLKSTKYITFKMENEDTTLEKYIILNSNAFLSFENKDAEQMLRSLRNMATQG